MVTRGQDGKSPPLRNYWRLWSANGFSNLGDGLYQFSLPVLALTLTSSPMLIAGVTTALTLAWPLFALHAGSLVDRTERRALMIMVNLLRLLLLGMLTLTGLTGHLVLPMLYITALLLGIGETLMDTALTAAVPTTVPPARLSWANARITAGQTVTNTFAAPPLAGLLTQLHPLLPAGTGALMYAVAGLALARMERPAVTSPSSTAERRGHLWEGLRFLWTVPLIRHLTLLTAAMNLFWGGWTAVIVLYAITPGPMGMSSVGYSLLLTAMGIGGLAGALLSERLARRIGLRAALMVDIFGTMVLLAVPALTAHPVAVAAAATFAGAGASIWVVLVATLRQQLVPPELLGRVYSASRLFSWGVTPLGAVLAGAAAHAWGVHTYFVISSLVAMLLLPAFCLTITPSALSAQKAASP